MITLFNPRRRPSRAPKSALLWVVGGCSMWLGVTLAMVGHGLSTLYGGVTPDAAGFIGLGLLLVAGGALIWRKA
jgi:hypothetical protein